jgi:uncharacterized protein with PIN domain
MLLAAQHMRLMLPQDEPTAKEPAPRLLVDAMLGRLAHWLRLMGYDAAYWRDGSDEALIAAAQAEDRLIVTRDHALARRRGVRAVLIAAEGLEEQILEARTALGGAPQPFTRCSECNGALVDLPHAAARDLVLPYVWQTQAQFRRCSDCGRIYWKGTHWPALHRRLEHDRS